VNRLPLIEYHEPQALEHFRLDLFRVAERTQLIGIPVAREQEYWDQMPHKTVTTISLHKGLVRTLREQVSLGA